MFVSFFYLLRQRGLDVSPNEWMTLLEGMEKGLHHSSLTGFYHLCRAIIVKSEVEYDRFDQIFLEFFRFKSNLACAVGNQVHQQVTAVHILQKVCYGGVKHNKFLQILVCLGCLGNDF